MKIDPNQRREPSDAVLDRVGIIIEGKAGSDLQSELSGVAEYLEAVAEDLYSTGTITIANKDRFRVFEPIYLWLRNTLTVFPGDLAGQVQEIYSSADLCQTIAAILHLSPRHLRASRFHEVNSTLPTIVRMCTDVMRVLMIGPRSGSKYVESSKLFDTRIALQRASGLVRYAASTANDPYESATVGFESHVDTSRIDKPKLAALLEQLARQVEELSDGNVKAVLREKVDQLRREVSSPKVKWGYVITSFFILFSFVADAKSIFPDAYDTVEQTVKEILETVHRSAQRHNSKTDPALPAPPVKPFLALPSPPARIRDKGKAENGEDGDQRAASIE